MVGNEGFGYEVAMKGGYERFTPYFRYFRYNIRSQILGSYFGLFSEIFRFIFENLASLVV